MDWTKIQQCKQRPNETVLDSFECFEKTYKQHSEWSPDSFKEHQSDPLLNSAFLEGSDEDLITLWLINYLKLSKRKKNIKLLKSRIYSSSN